VPAATSAVRPDRLSPPSGPGTECRITAQGHPRAIFQRALERGNLVVAEATLRELGRPTLTELLELTALIAFKDPHRHSRVAARWLLRWLDQHDQATIGDASLAAASLAALGGRHHRAALETLRSLAEEATGRRLR
jgi:hypothetical protein